MKTKGLDVCAQLHTLKHLCKHKQAQGSLEKRAYICRCIHTSYDLYKLMMKVYLFIYSKKELFHTLN